MLLATCSGIDTRMYVTWTAFRDRVASSLFVVPSLFVVAAVALAYLTMRLDSSLDWDPSDLPFGFASTVESGRAVLGTIASATITVAGIAFSIALLMLQLAASQYSPRVVQGLFRDPFNKRVVGIEVGTFTYCLVVLRSVRTSLESDGEPVIPNISIAVAVLLGITSVLAIVAFLNHNAHTMDVSEILATVTAQTVESLRATWPEQSDDHPAGQGGGDAHERRAPSTGALVVRSSSSGWIRFVDERAIADSLPQGTIARFEVAAGDFAVAGAPLCHVEPSPPDREELSAAIERAVRIGSTRTMAQDPAYGLQQLVDIALRALSPGVNDPTTADDAIRHIAATLAASYDRAPPPKHITAEHGGRIEMPAGRDHGDLTDLAFAEIRRAAAEHPRVAIAVMDAQGVLLRLAEERSIRSAEASLRRHARLLVEESARSGIHAEDLALVTDAYDRQFGVRRSSDARSDHDRAPGRRGHDPLG